MADVSVTTSTPPSSTSKNVLSGVSFTVDVYPVTTGTNFFTLISVGSASGNVTHTNNNLRNPTTFTVNITNTSSYSIVFNSIRSVDGGVIQRSYHTVSGTSSVAPITPTNITLGSSTQLASPTNVVVTAFGGNGSVTVSESATAGFIANGSSFTATRGVAKTFYAKSTSGGVDSAVKNQSITLPFLPTTGNADLVLSGADQSVHQDVASGTVSFSGGSTISYYQLVRSEDNVWPASTTPTPSGTDQELSAVGGTTIPSFAVSGNNWPGAGETYYYRVRSRLRGNYGGGGQDSDLVWVYSPFSNSITRGAVLTAPVVSSSQASLNSTTESATITASVALSSQGSPTGGTTSYTIYTSSTAYNTNNSFTDLNRGTSYSFGASYIRAGSDRVFATSVSFEVPYLATTAQGTVTSSVTLLGYSASATSVTLTGGNVASSHDYSINQGTPSNLTVSVPASTTSAVNHVYTLYVRRKQASGGDPNGGWVSSGNSVTINRAAVPVVPTGIALGNETEVELATVSYPIAGEGGSGGTLQIASYVSNTVGTLYLSPKSFTRTRGVVGYQWVATRDGGVTFSSPASVTIPYLPPDTSANINATSSTIAAGATSATTTVSGVTGTGMQVAIALNNGTTNLGAARVGNGTLTFTPATATGATTYEVFTARPVANGGNNFWTQTNNTFTVTRAAASDTAPNAFSFVDVTTTINTTHETTAVNLLGYDAATSLTAITSGAEFSINDGAFSSTVPTSVPTNANIKLKATSSSSPSTPLVFNVTIGGVTSGDWTITTAGSGNPAPFSFNALPSTTVTSVATNTAFTTTPAVSLSGMTINSTVTGLGAGTSYRLGGSGSFSTATGTTVTANTSLELRRTSSTLFSTPVTASIQIGTTTINWTITTSANTTSATYGVRIYNEGNVLTLDANTRVGNIMCSGSVDVTANTYDGDLYYTGTTGSITLTGMTTMNTGEYDVWLANSPIGSSGFLNEGITVNRGTNSFTLTYQRISSSPAMVAIKYMGFRY